MMNIHSATGIRRTEVLNAGNAVRLGSASRCATTERGSLPPAPFLFSTAYFFGCVTIAPML
jgi:hypothetical protein